MASKRTGAAAEREQRVAEVVAGWLDRQGLPPGGDRVLVVDDEDGGVERAVGRAGGQLRAWRRAAWEGRAARSWPADGEVDLALVRLPRGWLDLEMQLHATLARLRPGGRLWLYGGNDEGIKSAPRHLAEATGGAMSEVETLWIKQRTRILEALRPEGLALRDGLAAWRQELVVDLPGVGPRTLASYPGLFAHGRLDEGSALLLSVLPPVAPGARVLDFGCGAGALAMAVGARQPAAKLFLCDVDTVALVAARENVPGAQLLLGDGWGAVELGARFDLVLSNPPLHRGHAEDRGALDALVQQAPLRLVAGGRLVLVTWKVAGIAAALGERFARVDLLADACGYQVWQATAR